MKPTRGLSCTDCAAPTASPPYADSYECINWNTEGCEDTCVYRLAIDYGQLKAYIPNIFTPNNDGVNDFFTIFGSVNVSRISQLQIFDRYGELVFVAARYG